MHNINLQYDFICLSEIDILHIPGQVGLKFVIFVHQVYYFYKAQKTPCHLAYVDTMYTTDMYAY